MASSNLKKPVHRLLCAVALPVMAFGFSASVHSETLEPEMSVTYNVGVVSDYRVRSVSNSSSKPALQGGIDFAMKNGIYLGTAFSTVRWLKDVNGASKGNTEVDLYGGYRSAVTDTDFSYDVGVIGYRYPRNNSGSAVNTLVPVGTFVNANTTEIYGALTYKIYTLKYNRSVGNFLGNMHSAGSQYFDLSAGYDMTNGFLLTPHIGRQLIPNQAPLNGNYTDFSLTLNKDFGNGFSASVAAMTNTAKKPFYLDAKGEPFADSTVVIGAKYTF
jgi:uncharacterized protein (TIGR02001 family)